MSFKNLTPHDVTIRLANGDTMVLPKTGVEPRCSEVSTQVGEWEGVPLYTITYGEVENLPEPEEGVMLVVSFMVRAALPNRRDLASPGKLIRNGDGQIIGCEGLVVNR